MKKLKWILGILLVLVLAVGGVVVYFTQIKEYDVADEKVDEVLEEGFELELPDGTVIVVDKDGNVLEDVTPGTASEVATFPEGTTVNEDGTTVTLPDGTVTDNVTTLPAGAVVQANGEALLPTGETTAITYTSPTNTASNSGVANGLTTTDATNTETNTGEQTTANAGSSNTGTTNNTTDGNTSSNSGAGSTNDTTAPNAGEASTGGKPTVSDIKNKYAGSFASLEGQAASKLSGLIGTAKSEYSTAKANGESVSYAYFYQKYYGAAQSLESNTDNAFNALLSVVKNELQANGYDASYADSFVTQYESAKKAREASLLDQVKSQF